MRLAAIFRVRDDTDQMISEFDEIPDAEQECDPYFEDKSKQSFETEEPTA